MSLDCCTHEYHYDCIKQWTSDCESSCPLCKKVIKTLDYKNVGGEKVQEVVEDKLLNEPNFHCVGCRERIRITDI